MSTLYITMWAIGGLLLGVMSPRDVGLLAGSIITVAGIVFGCMLYRMEMPSLQVQGATAQLAKENKSVS